MKQYKINENYILTYKGTTYDVKVLSESNEKVKIRFRGSLKEAVLEKSKYELIKDSVNEVKYKEEMPNMLNETIKFASKDSKYIPTVNKNIGLDYLEKIGVKFNSKIDLKERKLDQETKSLF